MTRESFKSRLKRLMPQYDWRGHAWAPECRIHPYRIVVADSRNRAFKELRLKRGPAVGIWYFGGKYPGVAWQAGNDASVPYFVGEAIKYLQEDVLILARRLGLDVRRPT